MPTLRQFKKSQIVFYQGEVPSHAFRVKKGLVRAYIIHENGEEATIAFSGPEDIFPIATLFSNSHVAMFYYETAADTVCESYEWEELNEELERDARYELQHFVNRYNGSLLHIMSLAQNHARGKVVYTLRYLAMRFGEQLPDKRHYKISLLLTQQDIAKLCNISRETASIELGILKNEGVITKRLKQYVIHMPKLNAITGDEATPEIQV